MSPFVAYHSTVRRHRHSIRHSGLLVGQPTRGRPAGVYVYREDYGHPSFARFPSFVRWGSGPHNDVWQVAYIGPMTPDRYVENGLILLERVSPQHLSLITHITPRI